MHAPPAPLPVPRTRASPPLPCLASHPRASTARRSPAGSLCRVHPCDFPPVGSAQPPLSSPCGLSRQVGPDEWGCLSTGNSFWEPFRATTVCWHKGPIHHSSAELCLRDNWSGVGGRFLLWASFVPTILLAELEHIAHSIHPAVTRYLRAPLPEHSG